MPRSITLVSLLFTVGCSAVTGAVRTVAPEVLERGSSIYFGSSFPLTGEAAQPLFVYERRVAEADGALVATHITRDPGGAVAVVDSATSSKDYLLSQYTLHTNQSGQRGSVSVDGDQVTLGLDDGSGARTVVERQTAPVVVGPTLVGFVLTHLEALEKKQIISVRFAVVDRLETIGFTLEAVAAAPGNTRVKMAPESFFVSLAMKPIFFTFETATGKLVRIEGRVPPKVRTGDSLSDLDARVEYRYVAAAYQ